MYLKDIIPERMFEDTDFHYKATLQDGNPMKWAKSIVAFANGDGGTIFLGMISGSPFGNIRSFKTNYAKAKNPTISTILGLLWTTRLPKDSAIIRG